MTWPCEYPRATCKVDLGGAEVVMHSIVLARLVLEHLEVLRVSIGRASHIFYPFNDRLDHRVVLAPSSAPGIL